MSISLDNDKAPGQPIKASNGVTYIMTSPGVYVSVAPELEIPDDDIYVLRRGDNMSGSLHSPRFVGNFALDDLRKPST